MSTPTKNREANELRARALAVYAEISNPDVSMTAEQFTAKKAEYDTLTMRAQMLGEFTPEAEIARQGGEGDMQVVSPEQAATQEIPQNLQSRVETFRQNVTRTFGGTAGYLRAATLPNARLSIPQQRLMVEAKELTRTIVGTASDASGGEYLLPLEQEASIFRVDNGIPGLLQRARLYSMKGRTKRIPALVQTNEEITRPLSSISAVAIVGEASTKPTREPVFTQRVLTAYKYAAISQMSDEMLDDDFTGDLEPAMTQAIGQEILNQMNFDVTISGSGSSQPTGALHTSANAALIKVSRTTASRIKFADVTAMYVRHTHGPNSFWLVSRRAVGELMQMELSSGSSLTFLQTMVQDPANARLLGYPVVVSDFLNTLGAEGDIALVNPDHYAAALRRQLTVESSIHVGFTSDVTTWRFFARGGGIPIPTAPYAYRSVASSNVDEHSPFVVLDDVVIS